MIAPTRIREYISQAWVKLQRSASSCAAYGDTKLGGAPTLYLPHGEQVPPEIADLRDAGVAVAHLPRRIVQPGDVQPGELPSPGLLYLPHPYVVPGGMFNEMYGWDSYFIIRGLLADGLTEAAVAMANNWLYEIDHYGAILNANRTYYLTRSQPPFLTSAIRAIHHVTGDVGWLSRAYERAKRDHAMWARPPHLAGDTGLSRYYDLGQGPVPETGHQHDYYGQVREHAKRHRDCASYLDDDGRLSDDFYKGDRAARESGFDVSFRFGSFGGATHHYAPVCLNSLLYLAERDMAEFARQVQRPDESGHWVEKARRRARAIHHYLWNEDIGLFFDHDFTQRRQSSYHFATTFYPLWAGCATADQAARVAQHLDVFEHAHGLATSDRRSGAQWDMPYGWAPIHLIAVEGLLACGQRDAAVRIARKFNRLISENFRREGVVREKYDVVAGTAEKHVQVGYAENVIGFGWTNATYRIFENLL